jgi:hypothetical protein
MDGETIDRLIVRSENRIKRSWRAFIRDVKDANTLADIEAAIASGDLSRILNGIDDAAEALAADINGGFVASGEKTARWLDNSIRGTVRFDHTDEAAVGWMEDQWDTLTRAMAQEQLDVAQHVVRSGRARGLSPRQMAEEVYESIGLNMSQVDTVNRYRGALETGDKANALRRELTDGRYDQALRRLKPGQQLSPERVEAMVRAYRERWIRRRGETIALREANGAVHAGINEMLRQAFDAGLIPYISRTWQTRGDHKVRHSHRPMNGQTRNYGDSFVSGYGNQLRYPGDEDAPASETVNCRCVATTNITPTTSSGAEAVRVMSLT